MNELIYICPMHLEIRQTSQGICPICGMVLEPETSTIEAAPNPEYVDIKSRFWFSLMLTIPVFALAMSGHILNQWLPSEVSIWIQFLLATPVVLWQWHSLKKKCHSLNKVKLFT
jgi:P-type Cu+ transporter